VDQTETKIHAAFSEDQVERLTGISKRQLRYWDRTDFFKPQFAEENRRVAFSRVYSFMDVVSLRVLNVLRNQYSVPLQHLRRVAEALPQMSEAKWGSTQLFVFDRRVVFTEPGTAVYWEIVSKQYVIPIALQSVVTDTQRDIEALKERNENTVGRITRARNVCHNAWVIAGTRIPVAAIQRFSSAGYSVQEIKEEYPSLTDADIESAIQHKGDGIAA
jgi:uncharacterized protein (DUF433 family)